MLRHEDHEGSVPLGNRWFDNNSGSTFSVADTVTDVTLY